MEGGYFRESVKPYDNRNGLYEKFWQKNKPGFEPGLPCHRLMKTLELLVFARRGRLLERAPLFAGGALFSGWGRLVAFRAWGWAARATHGGLIELIQLVPGQDPFQLDFHVFFQVSDLSLLLTCQVQIGGHVRRDHRPDFVSIGMARAARPAWASRSAGATELTFALRAAPAAARAAELAFALGATTATAGPAELAFALRSTPAATLALGAAPAATLAFRRLRPGRHCDRHDGHQGDHLGDLLSCDHLF